MIAAVDGLRHRRVPPWALPVVIVVVAVVVLLATVFPTRTWWEQRGAIERAEEQLRVLRTENGRLEERALRLQDDAEIERLARERYNLVRPGEEAYAVLPAPAAPASADPVPPPDAPPDGPLERVLEAVNSLI